MTLSAIMLKTTAEFYLNLWCDVVSGTKDVSCRLNVTTVGAFDGEKSQLSIIDGVTFLS